MKKVAFHIIPAVLLAAAVSCQEKAITIPTSPVFELTVKAPGTKTVLGEKDGDTYPVLWSAGDKISVNGVESNALASGGSSTAKFTFAEQLTGPYNAVYPSSAVSEGKIVLPRYQNYVAGGFDPASAILLGTGEDEVTFKHAMSYVRITPTLGEEDVKISAIELNSYSKKLSGPFTTTSDYQTISETSDAYYRTEVFFDEPVDLGTSVMMAIPAQQYTDKIDIIVVAEDGRAMSVPSIAFTAAAGTIYSPSFEFKSDVLGDPAKLALYGPGTPGGWDSGSATVLAKTSDGVFEASSVALNQDVIKIYRLNGSGEFQWGEPYYIDSATKNTESNGVIDLRSIPIEWKGDPSLNISNWGLEAGVYDVKVDLNEMKLTLTESDETVYPEKLYTCGPAFQCGWSLGSMVLESTGKGIYTISDVQFVNKDEAFKFWENTSWGGEYIFNGVADASAHTAGIETRGDKDDSSFTLSTFGFSDTECYYTITVNLVTKVVIIQSTTPGHAYLYGCAFADHTDWADWIKLTETAAGSNVFTISNLRIKAGEGDYNYGFKVYLAVQDWDNEYRCDRSKSTDADNIFIEHKSNLGDDDAQVCPLDYGLGSGTYDVTVDFNTKKVTFTAK